MKSDVTELLAAELVKDVIPNVSGSLKDRNLDYTYTNYDDIGTIDTVNVSYNLSNITSSTSSEIIAEGSRFETLLTPAEDYILPTEITVKVNGVKITNYTYDNFAGTLIIPVGIINGDLEIIASAIVAIGNFFVSERLWIWLIMTFIITIVVCMAVFSNHVLR